MGSHNDLGKEGEERAAIWLTEKGFEILVRNYRYGKAEVDLIAKYDRFIVFVEVKTRTNYLFGYPEEAVTSSKQKLMMSAASNYLYENKLECECRFDVLSVLKSANNNWEFTHFEDAFFLYDD